MGQTRNKAEEVKICVNHQSRISDNKHVCWIDSRCLFIDRTKVLLWAIDSMTYLVSTCLVSFVY